MKYITLLLITAGLFLAACNQKSNSEKDNSAETAEKSVAKKSAYTVPDSLRQGLGKIYEGYLKS